MNEQKLLDLISNKRVLIYGAGMVGSLVLLRLRAMGVDEASIDFVVSKAEAGQRYLNHNVYCLDESIIDDQTVIIVSTLPRNQGQIIDNLQRHNVTGYIVVDEELYEDMERSYINSFMATHENSIVGDRDILFMASDNNYTSGAFLCMVDLCIEMINRGIRPLVVLPCYGNAEQLLIEKHIDYTYIQSGTGLAEGESYRDKETMNEEAVKKVETLIEKRHIKLVHNNTNHTFVGALAAQRTGTPYIWHVRENIAEQGFHFIDEDKSYSIINGAAKIINVSEYVGSCYPRQDKSKAVCIYDGVESEKYYCERQILKSDIIKILMPGMIAPLKGQHQLVEAARVLKKTGMNFYISFIGGSDADYIKKLEDMVEEYKLNDVIGFFSRVNNLEEWYKDSDIVVVCSRSEAFGRVTVEAQLAGCVVVGADCGATPELISDGNTGFLYELNNSGMLANKIIEACSDITKANAIAKNGQKNALEKYDKSLNCKNVIEEYKAILGDKL